ncbi:MAG TPA: hypothetical protein VGQ09_09585 [Chitinophagaceae bacterium]|jgi:hypothetical protein|nr:hypothetical protein [Chitinophagaceae bacterium]
MKLDVKTTPYFSAYPLKALNISSSASANNNKNTKGNIQTTKMARRLRVSPMINPYSEKKISINKIKLPVHIHPIDDNWFNNYE